jgi:hypothetical protein
MGKDQQLSVFCFHDVRFLIDVPIRREGIFFVTGFWKNNQGNREHRTSSYMDIEIPKTIFEKL